MSLQIEHIIAEQHGGPSAAENLALACGRCNRHKGTNLSGIDPESRSLTRLFNPRADSWEEHFEWKGACLTGRTAVGRTTIMVLRINHPEAVGHRKDLINEGHEL